MDLDKKQKYFEGVYKTEVDKIFRFVFFRVSSREEALDITEEVFYKFWQVISRDQSVDNSEAFLFASARNRVIDWYRKKRPESLDAMRERAEDNESLPFDVEDKDYGKALSVSVEAGWVLAALKNLSPEYREVMSMRFVDDLAPRQIAQILRVTPNAVSLRINHGLEKLRKELGINLDKDE